MPRKPPARPNGSGGPPGTRVGPVDADEEIRVTVLVRRRDGPTIDTAALGRTPPMQREHLTRDEYAARYGADPDALSAVEKLADDHGFEAESSIDKRSVVLHGRAGEFSEVFQVELAAPTAPDSFQTMYRHAHGELSGAFDDITVGGNAIPVAAGYSARRGWDPCTGLGTPNGERLLEGLNAPP